jgi:[ribosomal protein S18]-alanine N-acetyltransferase
MEIRWLIRRDLPEVLQIESRSFEFPWTEEEFTTCLRNRNCIGMVAEKDSNVAGYMIYELHKQRLHILNFAVRPEMRRIGAGSAMIDKLIGKLSADRRSRIMLEVRESNLEAQLFFRHNGFRCIDILKKFYDDTTEDAYLMQFHLLSEATSAVNCGSESFGL